MPSPFLEGGDQERFTLRNCHVFHAPYELPGVVFYVPKPFVTRGEGGRGRRPRVERFPAEAFMARGDPTLMLALDVGDTVSLTPRERVARAPSRGSSGGEQQQPPTTTSIRAHRRPSHPIAGRSDRRPDDDIHEAEGNTDNSGGTVCVIDALEMSASGRSARLELRLLFL